MSRRKPPAKPTQRKKPVPYTSMAMKFLRDYGYQVQVVERWCSFSRRRVDLFNVIDVVAVAHETTVGVQVTSGTNHSARKNKILESEKALNWCRAGNHLWIFSWAKKADKPGSKRKVWTPRIEMIFDTDFDLDVDPIPVSRFEPRLIVNTEGKQK